MKNEKLKQELTNYNINIDNKMIIYLNKLSKITLKRLYVKLSYDYFNNNQTELLRILSIILRIKFNDTFINIDEVGNNYNFDKFYELLGN